MIDPQKYAEKKVREPNFWRRKKYEVLARINDLFEDFSEDTLTELLLDKMQRGQDEHGIFSGTKADLQDEIEAEILDTVGWSVIEDWYEEQRG